MDRQGQLGTGVGARVAPQVVGVVAGVGDERGLPGTCHAAVHPARHGLGFVEEARARQRSGRGDHAQVAIAVEALDDRQVVVEAVVQLLDGQAADLSLVEQRRQLGRPPAGPGEALALLEPHVDSARQFRSG